MTDLKTPFQLSGKYILITGASSGIGRETAIMCSQMGAVVMLTGRSKERLNETFRELQYSGHHRMYALDLNDHRAVEDMIGELKTKEIKVHGVVNAAGISTTLPFKMTSPEKMEEYHRTNVISGFNLGRELIRQGVYARSGMSMIFISSVMGMVGEKGRTLYSMTKGALLAGARSMALELAGRKIRVNTISPGVVESPMSQKSVYSREKASLEKVRGQHPLGLGKTRDVANGCVYLLSDASRWITGTNLVIDGGYTTGKS